MKENYWTSTDNWIDSITFYIKKNLCNYKQKSEKLMLIFAIKQVWRLHNVKLITKINIILMCQHTGIMNYY